MFCPRYKDTLGPADPAGELSHKVRYTLDLGQTLAGAGDLLAGKCEELLVNVIEYLYTGTILLSGDDVCLYQAVADKLGCEALQAEVARFKSLNIPNTITGQYRRSFTILRPPPLSEIASLECSN